MKSFHIALLPAVLLATASTSCGDKQRAASADSAASVANSGPTVDSATAVQMAIASFGWGDSASVLVRGYRKDAAGMLFRLVRVCAPDADCYGQGGTVRVTFQGQVSQVPASEGP